MIIDSPTNCNHLKKLAWFYYMQNSRICVDMIVNNETPALRRLLESVKGIISDLEIVETGFSGSIMPKFIKSTIEEAGIPGRDIS